MFDPNDKRGLILQAAFSLFAASGFYHTTVEEIANEAGVGKGTVYEYFSSKKELLQEMLFWASEYYFERFPEEIEKFVGLKAKLKAMADIHFQFFLENREIARVVLFEHRYITEDLEEWFREKEAARIAYLVEILKDGATTDEIRSVDFGVVARMIVGFLWHMGVELIITSSEENWEQMSAGLVDILWKGIKK